MKESIVKAEDVLKMQETSKSVTANMENSNRKKVSGIKKAAEDAADQVKPKKNK